LAIASHHKASGLMARNFVWVSFYLTWCLHLKQSSLIFPWPSSALTLLLFSQCKTYFGIPSSVPFRDPLNPSSSNTGWRRETVKFEIIRKKTKETYKTLFGPEKLRQLSAVHFAVSIFFDFSQQVFTKL
jgi:hypothetical protein